MLEHLSPPSVHTFFQCPHKFYINKIEGIPDRTQYAMTVFGTAMHKALDIYSRVFDIRVSVDVLTETLKDLYGQVTVNTDMTECQLTQMGTIALTEFAMKFGATLVPVETEFPITIKRPNKIDIKTIIDYLDEDKIIDYKLGKSWFNTSNPYDYELNMFTYAYAYKEHFGKWPKLYIIRAKYRQKDRQTIFGDWVVDELNLQEDKAEDYFYFYDTVERAIKDGFFPRTLDKKFCGYCSYKGSTCAQTLPYINKEVQNVL